MQLENVIIPACVRGFSSNAVRFDVFIQNSAVVQITPAQAAPDSIASGTLIPCLVDAHVHIDKTYVVNEVGAADGDLGKAIELMGKHRAKWTVTDITQRMERALQDAYHHGTRAMRTHLDWVDDGVPDAAGVFETLRQKWRGRLVLQCVSLTPLDKFDSPAAGKSIAQELARMNRTGDALAGEAALLGAFVYRNADMRAKLQRVFDLATAHDLRLDFHVDEGLDTDACGLKMVAELTIANGYQGKVTCGHCCSLSVQPRNEAQATLELCLEAGIFLIALPTTNLYLQGAWDATPVERGITRLKEALALGMRAAVATDNVADGFYPYGSYNLMDSYGLAVQMGHLSPPDEAIATVTTHPALVMGLPWDGKIQVGCPADLLLLCATSSYELVTSGLGSAKRCSSYEQPAPSRLLA